MLRVALFRFGPPGVRDLIGAERDMALDLEGQNTIQLVGGRASDTDLPAQGLARRDL